MCATVNIVNAKSHWPRERFFQHSSKSSESSSSSSVASVSADDDNDDALEDDNDADAEVEHLLQKVVDRLKDCGLITDTIAIGENKFMGVCKLVKSGKQKAPFGRLDIRYKSGNDQC